MKTLLTKWLPIVTPILLVVLQGLIDNGAFSLSAHTLALVNAVLVSLGLGALHVRTK